MRNLLLFISLISSVGFYIHLSQPALWDQMMKIASGQASKVSALQPFIHDLLPEAKQQPGGNPVGLGQPPDQAQPSDQPARPAPAEAEYINPSTTTFTSTAHVRDVPQTDDSAQGSVGGFTPPTTLPSQPNWTWATTDGRHVYRNVVVCKVEADCVTILDDDGGARVAIADLPTDIQKQLNYDPDLAAAASAERQRQEQASQQALLAEKQMANTNKATEESNDAAIVSDEAKRQATNDAAVRVMQAQTELATWQDDLRITKGHVSNSPLTGQMMGDTYWISKYDEDTQNIAALQAVIRSGGKE